MDIGTLQALKSAGEEEELKRIKMYQLCRTDYLLRLIEEISSIEEPSFETKGNTIVPKYNLILLNEEQAQQWKENLQERRTELLGENGISPIVLT